MPYITVFEKVRNILSNECFDVAFKYNSSIKSLLVKNSNQHDNKARVYSVPCENCNLVYIGEMGRDWVVRVKEHKYAFKTYNMNNAIFYHAAENDHKILWEESKLLFKYNNFINRYMMESVLIDNISNLNLSKGCFKLDPVMHAVIVRCLAYHKMPLLCR